MLVVEDNIVNQRVISKFIERAGHVPFLASNGAEAVKLCTTMTFDLIFMDLEMPVMGGYEATRMIREQEQQQRMSPPRRTPIIGVSGNARQQHIEEALHGGVDDYLTKPFLEAQIRQVIEHHCHQEGKRNTR